LLVCKYDGINYCGFFFKMVYIHNFAYFYLYIIKGSESLGYMNHPKVSDVPTTQIFGDWGHPPAPPLATSLRVGVHCIPSFPPSHNPRL